MSAAVLALRKSVEDERARRSLHEFVKLYWDVVEPDTPFVDNWHIRSICEHLEAVTRGEILNLLINVPPGTSKSTLVSVMWPAWEWASRPSLRYFGASYSDALSIRDSWKCRDIIVCDRYAQAYPDTAIRPGSDAKLQYDLTAGGWRLATTVAGRGTGLHPHRKIIDDPHNVRKADSDVQRLEALRWFDQTLSSRGLVLNAATVVVMQRLHQLDLSGHIMASGNYSQWTHLVVPMEFEPDRVYPVSPLGNKDPRTKAGELLWPALFDKRKVETLKTALGEYGAAGQLQQRPSPAGGGILKVEHFQLWPARRALPDISFLVQSYDTAYTEKTENDPVACTVWGVFEHQNRRCALLVDAWSDHLGYPALRKRVTRDWNAKYGGVKTDPTHPAKGADVMLIEEKGSGLSLIQDLRLANLPVVPYNPGGASKPARAHLAAPLLEVDAFYLLESKRDAGKPVTWARDFVEQCEQFPNAEHDDYVDTFTQVVIYLHRTGQLTLPVAEEPPPEDYDYHDAPARRRRGSNPYGA